MRHTLFARCHGTVFRACLTVLGLTGSNACSVYDPSLLLPGPNDTGGQFGGSSSNQGGATSAGAGGTLAGGSSTTGGSGANAGTAGSSDGGVSSGGALVGGAGAVSSEGGNTSQAGSAQGGSAQGGSAQGGSAQGGTSAGSPAVLFSDDFEKGVVSWTTNTMNDWNVVSDTSNAYEESALSNVFRTATVGDDEWTDQSVEAKVKVASFGGTTTSYFAGVFARYVDDDNNYCLAVRGDGKYSIRRRLQGTSGTIGGAFAGIPFQTGTWHTLKLEVVGSTLNAYVDGVLFQTQTDTSFVKGRAGIGTTNASARFDDVRVLRP